MKSGLNWKGYLGASLILLPLAGNCLAEDAGTTQATIPKSIEASVTNSASSVESTPAELSPTNDIANAPVQAVSDLRPLPPDIRPTSPAAQVISLANSGVEEGVMLAFVTNSASTFNLGAEEIIYLKDIGVPDAVVTAMILRDQEIRTQPVAADVNPTPWVEAPAEAPAPPPSEVAPQPDPSVAGYPQQPPAAAPAVEVADDSGFYNGLSPYGTWNYLDGYGLCWQPTVVTVNPNWQPYYNCGQWAWTDCGWYWVSDYSWGWAPFHYGRWFRHSRLGWCWAPDHVWGPSWVSWRYTDGFCGWAPLPPGAAFIAGAGLTFHGRHVGPSEDLGLRPDHYRFVAWNHFRDRNLQHQSLAANQRDRVFRSSIAATRIGGNGQRVVNDGLSADQVAAASHIPVRTIALRESAAIAGGIGRAERFDVSERTLTIYRPKLAPSAPVAMRRASAGSASPSLSAGSQPAARSATAAPVNSPLARELSASSFTSASPGGWSPVNRTPRPGQNQPLVLRGPQSSAARESAPRSSMVIIGQKANAPGWTPNGPKAPATASPARSSESREPLAWTGSARGNVVRPPMDGRWQSGTPQANAVSPPAYVPQANRRWTGYDRSAEVYRPAPSYQAPSRSVPANVPRYAPAPANNTGRSYAAPPAAPARPAYSAPAQPSRNQR